MSDVLKQGTAVVLEGGTKVRVALHSDGDRKITEVEAHTLAMQILRTLTDPRGKWTVVDSKGVEVYGED